METAFIFLSIALILCGINEAANTTEEETLYTYKAAVVEYLPLRDSTLSAQERLELNTLEYVNLIKSVTEDIDIVVFPESTLTSGVDEASRSEVPIPFTEIICNSTDTKYLDHLKTLSCAAIEHNTTVVVNIVEKENCTLNNATGFCPSSGIVYYNSDVAFDERGAVSGRYRKWNLFGEYNLRPPAEVELTTITTRNNVTFGIFTCFDILFHEPALNLTKNLGLKNILFPTMWFSELPFLTALQAQQMWAQENNVNLLSAGANYPPAGSGGTGIFIGDLGPSEYAMVGGTGGTRLIIKTVPRPEFENNPYRRFTPIEEDVDSIAVEMDSFYLKTDSSLPDFSSVVLNTSETTVVQEVCNGDTITLCCKFRLTIKVDQSINSVLDKNKYVYHMVAFDGVRSFSGVRDGGIEACGLIACLNESISSCGRRFSNYSDVVWPITFQNVSITGNFSNSERRIQFPNSLLSSIRPISPQYAVWEKEESADVVKRTHSISVPQNRLLTFGIYGRDFSRDSSLNESSSYKSTKLLNDKLFVFVCVLYTFLVINNS